MTLPAPVIVVKDRLLAELGFHSALPSTNLVQRMVVSHLRGVGWLAGGTFSPAIAAEAWKPPMAGSS